MGIEFRRGFPFEVIFVGQNPRFCPSKGVAMSYLSLGIFGLLFGVLFCSVKDIAKLRVVFDFVILEFSFTMSS